MQVEGQRVHELADELGFNKQELVTRINDLDLGFTVNNFMTRLNENEVKQLKEALEQADAGEVEEEIETEASDDGGIGPTVIRRKKKEPAAEPDGEEAGGEEEEAEAESPAGGVVRRRPDEDEQEEEAAEAEAEKEEAPQAAEEAAEAEAEEPEEAVEAPETEEAVEEQAEREAEEVAEAAEEEVEEAAEAEAAEAEEVAETDEAEESEAEVDEAEQAAPPEASEPKQAPPESSPEEEEDGAQVTGRINQDVIKDRLAAEGKDFNPEKKKKEKKKKKKKKKKGGNGRRSRHRTRQVVEGNDLYDGDSRGRRRNKRQQKKQSRQQTQITEAAEHKRVIEMEDVISVGDLAEEMGVKAGEVAMKLLESGMQATVNTQLDYETAALIADEYGYTVENVAFDISDFYDTSPDPDETLSTRPPVVTVMGHVDHGKTSLLDAIRTSTIQSEEAGGITQHIGAHRVETEEGGITFLDTPGHEAFTALRARGAKATDIVVLVVAADDGVMPQTVEAINHAQDAGVPIVVAINKIDKPTANPDRIKQALTEYELIPEEWGGTTLYVEVSAIEHTNIEDLLESVHLQAEIEDFKANSQRKAQGLIIESELDTGRGPVATVLVQRGTLHLGDILVSGQFYGRVRTMHNDRGQEVESAQPSDPVEITGLDGVPEAGEPFFIVESESDAQRITEHVEEQRRKEVMAGRAKEVTAGSIEDLSAMIQEGEVKELKVIIKGDVQGSVEALKEAFNQLGNEEVRVQVIHSGVGSVTENDVNLAASSDTAALIIGFNVRPDSRASEIAEKQGVQILTHSVIYDAIDQVKNIREGLLEPIVEERSRGRVEVRELFESGQAGTIAGCYVTEGVINRNHKVRLIRDGQIVHEGEMASLRRYDDDVKEVREGFECGISLQNYNDIKIDDEIEAFEYVEVSATLS